MTSYNKKQKKQALCLSLSLVDSSTHLSSKPFRPRSSRGFTIVELLIVIVVIGILAAISIVAYSGISNNANDAAIKADLKGAMNKMAEYVVYGEPPYSDADRVTRLLAAMKGFSPSRAAYATGNNFVYCADNSSGVYGFGARSKSGKSFVYSSDKGLKELSASLPESGGGSSGACNLVTGTTSSLWSWGSSGGVWQSWLQ